MEQDDPPAHPSPIDPDVPSDEPSPPSGGLGPVLAAVAVGGVVGALARYAAARIWPTAARTFPWATLWVNVVGCALIGVLLVLVTEGRPVHRLWRPLLGTGVLGGFTTFSTYAVDLQNRLAAGCVGQAVGYGVGTLLGAMLAVTAATALTRRFAVHR
ncbi:MAG TPA: fluoride efflux transporter CrcB [Sporichthyaceae bacterium]|nr:fluoride efflux transporter CrcB [Sporichthyaceae bacterium]